MAAASLSPRLRFRPMPEFLFNTNRIDTDLPPGSRVLDFIRDDQGLPGTRSACREGDCGACLVLAGSLRDGYLQYLPLNSCLLPLAALQGRHLVSIEGIGTDALNPIQQALVGHGAIQCGYCTPGLVMAITGYFLSAASTSLEDAIHAVSGNLCRCAGYAGIERALAALCGQFELAASPPQQRISDLVGWRILPLYFLDIAGRLRALPAAEGVPDDVPEDDALPIAGGTDLLVQKGDALARQPLHFLPSREDIQLAGQTCRIDASTRIETLRTSALLQTLLPDIGEDFKLICSPAVRQQATLGGNLVNASPIADLAICFLALNAMLELRSAAGSRSLPLKDFYRGYKELDLQPGERLRSIQFDCPEEPLRFSFEKVCKRMHLDIASVNSAMLLQVRDGCFARVHISTGGVAPIPLYLHKTCAWLEDRPVDAGVVRQALRVAQGEISPISDIRGSEAYKRLLLRQLLTAHFLKLLPQHLHWEDLRCP